MRPILFCVALTLAAAAASRAQSAQPRRVLDNPQVRVFETTGPAFDGVGHGAGVIVVLDDAPGHVAGDAFWADDVAQAGSRVNQTRVAIVIPKPAAPAPAPVDAGSKPGDAPFTGMSFRTLFENDHVAVIRARMDVGAREAVHTHASDTIVVHLSGGRIEDTPAGGKTGLNTWKHGDVEFEARGSSHSARNAGDAVEVVLVTLKPLAR